MPIHHALCTCQNCGPCFWAFSQHTPIARLELRHRLRVKARWCLLAAMLIHPVLYLLFELVLFVLSSMLALDIILVNAYSCHQVFDL
jgi:hypothetical protein